MKKQKKCSSYLPHLDPRRLNRASECGRRRN